VEGAEYRVLKGFGRYIDFCRAIIVEVHPSLMYRLGSSPKRLYKLLNEHGYRLYLINTSNLIPDT
jgi:hypothetical protein